MEAFGQLFREHASELDDLGRFRHIVPLTNKGSLGQIVEVVCEAEDDLINIELSTKIKDTYYTLATMSINTNEPDLDSMTMYNHIADFSPKYLQVTLDDMIRSKKPYELRNALHEANQTSITEFHYSPTLIENSYTMSEHGLRETGRERFAVGIKNGRMVMQPYDEFDNVDYLKNSNGEIIVFNDLDDKESLLLIFMFCHLQSCQSHDIIVIYVKGEYYVKIRNISCRHSRFGANRH